MMGRPDPVTAQPQIDLCRALHVPVTLGDRSRYTVGQSLDAKFHSNGPAARWGSDI